MTHPMFKAIISLIRVRQWYKNLLIFLPLIFTGLLFDRPSFINTLIGFFALSFLSSVNYVINDIMDVKKDRTHPEKRMRPIASGKIPVPLATLIALILLIASILIALSFSPYFLVSLGALFFLTLIYSFGLKNEPFVDILLISFNFVLRAISGTFVINTAFISPWLILCPFFLALFLAVGKRESDLLFLGKKAQKHKPVLKFYTPQITNALLIITTTATIMSYAAYAFQSNTGKLVFTLPFAIYVILRYMYHIYEGSEISRNTELIVKDWRLLTGAILWVVSTLAILYLGI